MRLLGSSLALLLALTTGAFAQTKNIDQLSTGVTPSGSEVIPLVQGADPAVKLTLNQIISALVSISAGCGNSTGAGAISVGSINAVLQQVSTNNTAYPITVGNCGQVVYFDAVAGGTPSLPAAGSTGFPYGFPLTLCNEAAGTEVVTPVSGTIGGLSTYSITGGTPANPICVGFTSDGVSNWKVIAGGGGGGGTGNVVGPGSSTTHDVVSYGDTTGKLIEDTGAMTFSSLRSIFNGPIRVPARQATSTNDFVFSTSDYFVCAQNSSGAASETMPTSPATGDTYLVKDCTGLAASNNITLKPASGLIDGASTFVLNTARQAVALTYTGWGWMTN